MKNTQKRSKPGPRPTYSSAMVIVACSLPKELIDKARAIGDGNLSKGIRKAIEKW